MMDEKKFDVAAVVVGVFAPMSLLLLLLYSFCS